MEADPHPLPQEEKQTEHLLGPIRRIFERKELFLKHGYDLDHERDVLLDQAAPLSGKILEAGTGKGHFAAALARRGLAFTSFDISKEESALAGLYLKFYGLERFADLRVEDGEQLSFPDETFDMVFSISTLHHFKNPPKVLGELCRVLKPKGRLVLSDFTEKGFDTLDRIHALEGNTHDRGLMKISGAAAYLEDKKFRIKLSGATSFHETVIAEKRP